MQLNKLYRALWLEEVPEDGASPVAATPAPETPPTGLVDDVAPIVDEPIPGADNTPASIDDEDRSSDFADLIADDDDTGEDFTATPEVAEPVAPAVEPPVAAEPAPVEPSPSEPPPVAATPPETPQAPAEPQVPAQEPPPEIDYTKLREDFVNLLETDTYKLSDDEATAAISEPEKALPRLAAKVHANVLDAVTHGLMQQMPNVVQKILVSQMQQTQAANSFYEKWPALAEHRGQVMQVANIYKQMNPNVPVEEAIQQIGLQASVMLGLPIEGYSDAAPAPTPDVPVTPPPVPPQPIVPGGAGVGAPLTTVPSDNLFEELANDFIREDLS